MRHLCETCAHAGVACPYVGVRATARVDDKANRAGLVANMSGWIVKCDKFIARKWPQEQPTVPAAESHDPAHYKGGGIECIDAIRAASTREEFVAYCRLTAMKYVWRFGKKDDAAVEARKAAVYLRWAQEALEGKPLTKG